MQTLYLIRGLPGSGKSTVGEQMFKKGLVSLHVEADMYFNCGDYYAFDASKLYFAHEWCQDRTRLYLASGQSVAVTNTSTTEKEVAVYAKIAAETGSMFVSLIAENRHDGINVHNVPAETLLKMKNRFTVKL